MEALRERQNAPARSLIAALSDHPRAVILGDPGSGKSTALNYLALGLCGVVRDEDFANDWRQRPILPLRVELRSFAQWWTVNLRQTEEPHSALLRFIAAETLPEASQALGQQLDGVLRQRGAALLLDGLDEVPFDQRVPVKRAVEGVMTRYPRCRVIVTCRTYSYQDPRQQITPAGLDLAELRIQDLETDQIALFVRKWYAQLARQRDKPDYSEDLIRQIETNARLRKLAATLLLLALIASLHSIRRTRLPDERHVLLREAIELLRVRWQRVNKQLPQGSSLRQAEEKVFGALEQGAVKEALLRELYKLAFDVHALATSEQIEQDDATADIPEQRLRGALENALQQTSTALLPDELTLYLRNRAGLLINKGDALKDGRPVYRFPHRMIQEYLASQAFAANPEHVSGRLKADFARWREVYALMALSSGPHGALACIEEICDEAAPALDEADWRGAALSAEIWADLRLTGELSRGIKRSLRHTAETLIRLLESPQKLSPLERAAAGRATACF